MRVLLDRLARIRHAEPGRGITFDESRDLVCDTACRANAAVERIHTSALSFR